MSEIEVTNTNPINEVSEVKRKFFLVLFEDTGTERERIYAADAAAFYHFATEELKALEKCETEEINKENKINPIEIENSGVRVLKVFEINESNGFSIDVKSSYDPVKGLRTDAATQDLS